MSLRYQTFTIRIVALALLEVFKYVTYVRIIRRGTALRSAEEPGRYTRPLGPGLLQGLEQPEPIWRARISLDRRTRSR